MSIWDSVINKGPSTLWDFPAAPKKASDIVIPKVSPAPQNKLLPKLPQAPQTVSPQAVGVGGPKYDAGLPSPYNIRQPATPVLEFGKAVIQAPGYAGATLSASIAQHLSGTPTAVDPTKVPGLSILAGTQPIQSIQTRLPQDTSAVQSLGIPTPVAQGIAGLSVIGGLALDASGVGGFGKKALPALMVGIDNFSGALKLGQQIGVAPDLLDDFARFTVAVKDEKIAADYLASLERLQQSSKGTSGNTRALDVNAPKSDNGAWPDTTSSKPLKVDDMSTGNAPTGKEGVSAQRAGTSDPFEGTYKVFHGSDKKSVSFDKDQPTFFTSSKEYAGRYGDNTHELSIELKKPYRVDAAKHEMGPDVEELAYDKNWVAARKAEGYDGMIIKDGDVTDYVVFSNKNINPSPSIPKELEPLAAEARKYKTAEEFVAKQPKLYHATKRVFEEFNPNANPEDFGTWFAKEKTDMESFPIVHERVLKPNVKLLPEDNLDELMEKTIDDDRPFPQAYLDMGYRGIDYGNDTIQLWKPNEDTLTKQALTDFFNKVKGGTPKGDRPFDATPASKLKGAQAKTETPAPPTTPDNLQNGSLPPSIPRNLNRVAASAAARNPKARPFIGKVKEAYTRFVEYLQNSEERMRKLVASPEMKVSDASDPYLRATLSPGRVDTKIRLGYDKAQDVASDITAIARDRNLGVSIMRTEVNRYLQALHAPERNAALGDGAAGITTAEAKIITAAATPEVKAVAEKVLAINREVLEMLHEAGVIGDDLLKTLRDKYQNHVPLQRIFEGDDDVGIILSGKGFDVKSTGIKTAVGSDREVADILSNVLLNYEQAVLRSEKNIVDLATLKFVRDNEDALGHLVKVRKPKAVGQSHDGKALLEHTQDPKILQMFEDGKRVWIEFQDERLAIAFRGVGREKLPSLLNAIGVFTRLYSQLMTRFEPGFALPNKMRDLQETAVYMAAQKDIGFGGAAKVALRDPISMKAVMDAMRGADTPGAKLYNEMRELGGTTGGFALSSRAQVDMNVEKLFRNAQSNPRQAAGKLLEYIDNWNKLFEDSTRLSVYKQALSQGLSKERAAFLAKEASINFNRMGKGGPVINSLWMFANASIQGSFKMIRSLKDPRVAGSVIAVVGGSVAAVNQYNDRVDPEWREKVTKWDRLNSLVVVLPQEEGQPFKYFSIPVSWGLKPIKVMADYAYDATTGEDFDTKTMVADLFTSVIEAYNPVGGTDLTSAVTPTILDIGVEIARNQKWSGAPIKPNFNPNAPEDIKYFNSLTETTTGRGAIAATKALQESTGIAISPADIDYAFQQLVGGTGRFVSRTANTLWGAATGEPVPADHYPFLSRFYRERDEEELTIGTGENEKLDALEGEAARASHYEKQEARQIWESIKDLPDDDVISRMKTLKQDSPDLYERVKDIGEADRLGLQGIDKRLKSATVDTRAQYILEKLNATKTDDEWNAVLDDYVAKKILTNAVAKRIKELNQ